MPAESRIQSEPLRRVVIAIIMGGVLAASTGGAVFLSGKTPRERPSTAGVRQDLRIFSVERPKSWSSVDAPPDASELGYGVIFDEPSWPQRRLVALELEYALPTPPQAAAADFLGEFDKSPQAPVDRSRVGPFFVNYYLDSTRKHEWVAALLTTDGRKYLGLYLMRDSPLGESDEELFQSVVGSVRDERFMPLPRTFLLPAGVSLDVPPGLSALRYQYHDALDHVVFHPEGDAKFFALHLAPVELTPRPGGQRPRSGLPLPEMQWEELLGALMPTDRLAEALYLHFHQATGRWPDASQVRAFRTNGKTGYVLLLKDTRGSGVYEALWGMWVNDEHALLIELVAGRDAAQPAVDAAKAIVQSLARVKEAPSPPMD